MLARPNHGAIAHSRGKLRPIIEGSKKLGGQGESRNDAFLIGDNGRVDPPMRVDEEAGRDVGLGGVFLEGVTN